MFNEDVIELTDNNFGESIKKYENIFVIFYSPLSGYCKVFAHEFSLASSELKGKKYILWKN